MAKLGMWQISIDAEREQEIGRDIKILYKDKLVKGITDIRLRLIKMKDDVGANLLVKDCKEKVI